MRNVLYVTLLRMNDVIVQSRLQQNVKLDFSGRERWPAVFAFGRVDFHHPAAADRSDRHGGKASGV